MQPTASFEVPPGRTVGLSYQAVLVDILDATPVISRYVCKPSSVSHLAGALLAVPLDRAYFVRITCHPISCGSALTTPLTRTSASASFQTLLDLSCSGQLLGHLLPVSVSCTHIFACAHVRTPGMPAVPWSEDRSSTLHRTCSFHCIRRKAMSHRPLAGGDVVVANHGRNTPLGKSVTGGVGAPLCLLFRKYKGAPSPMMRHPETAACGWIYFASVCNFGSLFHLHL